MRRDIPVMVFKTKQDVYICRACYNSQNINTTVINRCSSIFIRTCDIYAEIQFDNKEHTIIMSTCGFCDIKQYHNNDCLTNEQCEDCKTRDNAIKLYKQNNNLL